MGVQLLLMVKATLVVAIKLPDVPVMVTVNAPTAAELLAVNVITLDPVVGFVPNEAVTPLGRPDAARVTLPVNPFTSVTVIVSVPLLPCVTDKLDDFGASVKLPVGAVTVTTNVSVLAQAVALVYVATNVLAPVLNGIPSISRAVDANPLGPAQLQVPPVRGCGPRFTVDPEATVVLAISCQAAPFTCR